MGGFLIPQAGGGSMAKPNLRPDHNGTQRAQFKDGFSAY